MNNVGKRIKQKREEYGWTQEELASKMGYKSKSTINKIEMGKNDVVQSNVVKFAKVLNTTPAFLMGWNAEDTNTPIEYKMTAEKEKDNEAMSDIIVRMRMDRDFLSVVESLYSLNGEQLKGVKQMLNAFLK